MNANGSLPAASRAPATTRSSAAWCAASSGATGRGAAAAVGSGVGSAAVTDFAAAGWSSRASASCVGDLARPLHDAIAIASTTGLRITSTWADAWRLVKRGVAVASIALAIAGCHTATHGARERTVVEQHADTRAPAASHGLPRLSDEHRRALFSSPQDDPPVVFGGVTEGAQGQHYLTSNEGGLHAFEPHIRGKGGAYLGVGTDQAYLMLGWARSEFAWLVDYDPMVADLHGVYRALLLEAETPEDFLALWSKERRSDAHAAIDLHAPSDARARLRTLFRQQRARVAKRLAETMATMATAKVPCWLDDAAQYDHVRDLVRSGRTRAMVVDLAGNRGLRGIGKAARAAGLELRVVYLSNAEEYWRLYPKAFRSNLVDLPMPDGALVLRTLLIWHVNRDYRYNVQRADNLRAWLAQPWVGNVYHLTYQRPEADPTGLNLFEVDVWPEDAPKALQSAARRKIRELEAEGHGV
jgi:hypothetical protein